MTMGVHEESQHPDELAAEATSSGRVANGAAGGGAASSAAAVDAAGGAANEITDAPVSEDSGESASAVLAVSSSGAASGAPADAVDEIAAGNAQVAKILDKISAFLEFKGENFFKIRSYQVASDAIEDSKASIAGITKRGGAAELQKIEGIGKGISAQIVEIVQTGTCSVYEALKSETPETVLDLLKVSGVGMKTARLLYKDFGIKSLDELRSFAAGGGLTSVPGVGEKSIKRIENSLNRLLPA
ncbi:MAG TPA: helix-hairpin-helix domain-containing protein [Blastocatellia bacterium]|nr:helix-hairpin-helix domain-containing protein [Blastocatellia bacterium]